MTKKVKFMIILSGLGMVSDDLVMKNKKNFTLSLTIPCTWHTWLNKLMKHSTHFLPFTEFLGATINANVHLSRAFCYIVNNVVYEDVN